MLKNWNWTQDYYSQSLSDFLCIQWCCQLCFNIDLDTQSRKHIKWNNLEDLSMQKYRFITPNKYIGEIFLKLASENDASLKVDIRLIE
jgi:hypothetical protein